MRVSTRTEYGLRALIELATQKDGTPVSAKELAARQQVPARFLEQQITALRKAGLITSRRGAGGGCSLARPAGEISVADAMEALEGQVIGAPDGEVTTSASRATSELWKQVGGTVRAALAQITLADLAARKEELDQAASPMFYI